MRTVEVLPELMARAREHIEEDRSVVVLQARRRNPASSEPDSLFLAQTTGAPVNNDHMSRRISNLMRSVGIENASGHRLRARGLTTLTEAYDGVDDSGRSLPPRTGSVEGCPACWPPRLAIASPVSEHGPQCQARNAGRRPDSHAVTYADTRAQERGAGVQAADLCAGFPLIAALVCTRRSCRFQRQAPLELLGARLDELTDERSVGESVCKCCSRG